MPDSKIFCNIPWFEININHDGSYDLCGCQNNKIVDTDLGKIYNIRRLPIDQYWNSDRLKSSRMIKLGSEPDPMCRMCQIKDRTGYISNRVKENNKSLIFQQAFDRSFEQSPHKNYFEHSQSTQGETISEIRSLHVNLGATCNFACRMCSPRYSTRLQTDYKQLSWVPMDRSYDHWTDDPQGWKNFTSFLDQRGENIRVIHIIGGEVEFMPKFDWLIDFFIDRGLASQVNISFTTNGSIDYTRHWQRLSQYRRCEIGISIESIDPIGDYIRQGGDIKSILSNIENYVANVPDNFTVAIRTVPSLLSLPTYGNLIRWTYQRRIPIDNSLLVSPAWLQATLLPEDLKQDIIADLENLRSLLPEINGFVNQKDTHRIDASTRNECDSMINLCNVSLPGNFEELRKICAEKLDQWDRMKRINLRDYHLGLYEFLKAYGYRGS